MCINLRNGFNNREGKGKHSFKAEVRMMGWVCQAREVCTYCGVYGAPSMLLPDNSVFKKCKCFGSRMARKSGRRDPCKAFARKRKGKVSVLYSACQGRKTVPLKLVMHFYVCISHTLRRMLFLGWQEESLQHRTLSESAPREEDP